MAIKFKLADDEKEKAKRLLKEMEEKESISERQVARQQEKERVNKAFEENNRLPVAEDGYVAKKNKINIGDLLTAGSMSRFNMDIGANEAFERIINPKSREEDNRKYFEPGAFKDGYQFGDITKTITGTAADIGQDLTNGVIGIGEGLVDTGAYLIGLKSKWEKDFINSIDKNKLTEKQREDLLKRYIANKQVDSQMKNYIKRDLVGESNIGNLAGNTGVLGTANMMLNGRTDKKSDEFERDSVLGEKSDSLVQSAGQLAGQAGLTMVGVPWWVTSGVSSFGGGVQEAYLKNATNEQAGIYGLISAGAEILSERISGGISFGEKTLDESLKKALTDTISDRTLKALTKFGFDAFGEGFEEVFSDVISNIGRKLTYDKDGTWKEILSSPEKMDKWLKSTIKDVLGLDAREQYEESFIGGAALGGGTNTLRLGNSIKNKVDYDTGKPVEQEKMQDQQVIPQENKIAQNGLSEQLPVSNKENSFSNKLKEQARQEIQNSKINAEEKRAMLEALDKVDTITEKDINDIRQTINNATQESQIEQNKSRSFEDIAEEAMFSGEYDTVSSPLENRNINTIGQERNVNAYQYDNPEVKPYFQQMAQMLGEDVSNISSKDNRKTQRGGGTSLTTTIPAVKQLHEDMGYSYNQILDGLQNIVDDNGKENNALSKKIEIIIDEQLRNGYRNSYGRIIDPNQDYINLITGNTTNEVLARASEVNQNNIAPTAQDALPTQNKQTQNSTEDLKQQQLDIIKENNAMTDDYHTGIRDINDIKTFEEVIDDDESFVYGDFSREDAQKALKDGKVTVYSSKPIEQGSFVSTSQNMARDYAGSGQIYSQEVDLNDVAWINGDEGQYAKINDNNILRLENRVSGDALLNAQDLINDIKEVGAEVDNNGYVTLYHRTTPENAKQILETGKMKAQEDGLFFSTNRNGENNSNYGDAVIELKVPAEMLELNDIFDDEASIRIPLENKNEVLDISDYIENNQNTLYNSNESESDINGAIQRRTVEGSVKDNWLTEETIKKQFSKEGFKELATRARQNQTKQLTEKQIAIKKEYENKIKKEIRFFDGAEDDMMAFASPDEYGVIYFNSANYEQHDARKMAYHESLENEITHNKEIQELAKKAIWIMQNDESFKNSKQINAFYKDSIRTLENPYAVAKDILCDMYAKYKTGEELDYNNLLDLDTNIIIDDTLTKIDNILNKNSNKSSFSMQNAAPTAGETQVAERPRKGKEVIDTKQETKKEQEQIAKILDEPITKQNEKSRAWAIAKANLIDKGIVFEELSHKTKNRELQGKWDYTLTAGARGQNAIGQARYEMDANNKTQKQISKSLEDIRSEVGKNTSEFQNYMYHQLNIDRMTLEERFAGDTGTNYERKDAIKNKPVFGENIDADYSRRKVAEYEKAHPEFKEYAQDVYDFLDANKKELVDRGVISQELSDRLAELYPHYVPIKRVDAKGAAIKVPLDTNRTGINSPLARATGGSSDIQPLFQTIADRTMQTYRASARNNFGLELMNTLNSVTESNQTDIDTIIEEIGDENTELLKEGKNGQNPTFTVFNNGEKTTFEITKDMYDALKPQSEFIKNMNNSKLSKGLNAVSNFRRGVLTEYNPVFSLTNAMKDAQDVVINSQHPAKTFAKFPESYAQILQKGYWYNEYLQNGGEQNSYFKDGEFTSDKKQSKLKTAATLPLEAISKVNNVIEMAPRLAEYIASREAGRSVETSMLDAARVTTNFKAGGDITKTLNRNGVTFLNASVQGFQQQIRNIQEANVKGLKGYAALATKYAIAGLPALLLNGLIWKDDKDYEELQDYAKDNYYIIAKYGDGKFIRIPKGRVAATVQKIVSNATEYLTDDKKSLNIDNLAKDFWEDLKFAQDNIAPNNPLDNNVISPIIQAITNKTWYGSDLVPSRLQNKPKNEQYDESTDSLSIWLGDKLDVSPYKINYLLDQYGGGVSDLVLPRMTKQAENSMLEDKFTTDSVMKNKYPGDFYSELDELKIKANSIDAKDEDILKYKYNSSVSGKLGELYTKKREIQNSDLTDSQKKEKLKVVQKEINNLAKEALESTDKLKISGDTATIKDTQYYKTTSDGETKWNKITDKEKEKNTNISLKTYSDYKNKVAGKTKDAEKIDVLLNSSYSKKEKQAIYENYIGTNDKNMDLVKDFNIDIDEYLKYKTTNFSADKIDDGTLKGKSVSGSAKNKRYDYIMNMNLTGVQKMVLYGLEYTPTKSNKQTIVNYIVNMEGKKKQEKLDLLGRFSWITIYKDGTFDY